MAVPDGPDHGLTQLVCVTGYLLSEFDLQITFFGRGGLAVEDTCTAVLEGRHLIYELTIDHGWIHIRGQGMDAAAPELLCTLADNAQNWRAVGFVVGTLEAHQIRDVSRFREQRGRFKSEKSVRTVC